MEGGRRSRRGHHLGTDRRRWGLRQSGLARLRRGAFGPPVGRRRPDRRSSRPRQPEDQRLLEQSRHHGQGPERPRARGLPLGFRRRQAARATTTPRVSAPQGPAVKIAGAAPKVATARAATPVRAALGGTGTPWWGSYWSAPATTTGKMFFTDHKGGNWVCSGSLVNSPAQNVVITAGHCVYGTAGGELPAGETWHSNWVFAPDYSNGYAPYGYWTARQLWTLTNYANQRR